MMNKSIEQLALLWIRHANGQTGSDTILAGGLQMVSQKIDKEVDPGVSSISFKSSPYRVKVKDATVFAKSALEALYLPFIFETDVWIETFCPTSGTPIAMYVTQDGLISSSPAECVLSVVFPDEMDGDSATSSAHISHLAGQLSRFFSSRAAAMTWLVAYPHVAILPAIDAWRFAILIHDEGYYPSK
jgi:hypothetical protein